MRQISGASLDAISQASGLEPVIIVRVFWSGQPTSYCDRKFEQEGLVGRLLEISGIEDVVDISSSASSVQLSVSLDDSDGSIKNIFNFNDIHLVYVQVLQWFSHIPLSDAFVIFEGQISSPIVWSEGARTLKFDVVTKINDVEVGFSAEEADFPFLPTNLIGKSWPIVFGSVPGSVVLDLNESPSAVFASGFAIVDHDQWEEELNDMSKAIAEAMEKSRAAWIAGLNNAYKAAQFKKFNSGGFDEDPAQADQYDTAASSFYAQSFNFQQEATRISIEQSQKGAQYKLQKSLEFRIIPISQTNIPPGVPFRIEFGNYTANAIVAANQIVLTAIAEKVDVNAKVGTNKYAFGVKAVTDEYSQENKGQKFVWIDGGTEIKIFNYPRIMIVSIGVVNVVNVWANTKYGLAVVPRNYYIVDLQNLGGGLVITRLVFPTPLESLPGFWQAGTISVDVISPIGPNVVDIMRWVIDRWGQFPIDETSWNYVRGKVAALPAHFTLDRRMNVVQFLNDVAFQARCAIWLNDRRYYIRFLPEELTPVESITDSDVESNSLEITCTETERLITKFVAKWKARRDQDKENLVVLRYNIQKYGTLTEEYDFWIYNNVECVTKAAEFWMIRKSNTFKIIRCSVTLNKLRIEAFDPVQVSFNEPLVAIEPVTGIVQRASFNPDEDTVELEVWLPVRFGEMTKYTFAYPGSTNLIYPVINDPYIHTGNPYEGALNQLLPPIYLPQAVPITYSHGDPFTHGSGLPGNVDPNPSSVGVVTILNPNAISQTRPNGISLFNNKTKFQIRDLQAFPFKNTGPATFYGEVVQQDEDAYTYKVNCWMRGFDFAPSVQTVRIGQIDENTTLPAGYPLIVIRNVFTLKDPLGNESVGIEFVAQPSIWVPLPTEDKP